MPFDRRRFVGACAGALGSALFACAQAQDAEPKTRVILLGTKGGPRSAARGARTLRPCC